MEYQERLLQGSPVTSPEVPRELSQEDADSEDMSKDSDSDFSYSESEQGFFKENEAYHHKMTSLRDSLLHGKLR